MWRKILGTVAVLGLCAAVQPARAESVLDGNWNGWGQVTLQEKGGTYKGTYTDTYGGDGTFEFTRMGGGQFKGKWGEGPRRHGTFTLSLSGDANTMNVDWKADPTGAITSPAGGKDTWTRATKLDLEWRPVDLVTEKYGDREFGSKTLERLRKAAQKWLDKTNPTAGKLAKTLPAAFSISRAVNVFVTYALVDKTTGKVYDTQVKQLDDGDSAHWWAKDAASFNGDEADRDRIIKLRRPTYRCPELASK